MKQQVTRLRQALSQRQKRHIVDASRVPSAVLLPIYYKWEQYYILFTKRTEKVQAHKGQISFPGGAYQDGDETLVNTALRECEEEIGLMAHHVEVLGELDDVVTKTSSYIISPFVALIPWPYQFKVNGEEAEEIIRLHNQRGQVENFIKEIKEGFGMEWMPCGESYANAVFFRIGIIAYNLFIAMKLLALSPWYRNFTIQTVRWRLYQIAGAVVRHANQVWFKLKAPLEKIELFCRFRVRCYGLAYG